MNAGSAPTDLLIQLIPSAQVSQTDLFVITSRLGLGQLQIT